MGEAPRPGPTLADGGNADVQHGFTLFAPLPASERLATANQVRASA